MPTLVPGPAYLEAVGNKTKVIEEFIGRVGTGHRGVSIARMRSPAGWISPGQTPEFDEFRIVLKGVLVVKSKEDSFEVGAGQAVISAQGEWVQYSTPHPGGADYLAICLPAFSPDLVHRDA